MKYALTWDLDTIFPGGSSSPQLKEKIHSVSSELAELENKVNSWQPEEDKPDYFNFRSILALCDKVADGLNQSASFITALQSADVKDSKAGALLGQIYQLSSSFSISNTRISKKILMIAAADWNGLLQKEPFKAIAFGLQEMRRDAEKLLSEAEETLLAALRVDGFQAWSSHYDTIVSMIKIPFQNEKGETIELSAGQAMNRMYADPDPAVRAELFQKWEQAWAEQAPVLADTLNHLQGFRLTDYKAHKAGSFLEEPLRYNRMKEETLDAMWNAISQRKSLFIAFLNRKAALMQKEKLSWVDVDAPVSIGEAKLRTFTFDEAVDFIIANFAGFGEKLASFAQQAIENRWVEAENRSGKRPGGYCTDIPESQQSRIFMTFTGSASDMSTLAHELGHAYHSYVMRDLPRLNRNYAMNVAETASTFAETIISSATVEAASSAEEKISLLNTKLENAIAMFLNIHSRFLFEKSFYAEREKGIVTKERLAELMTAAQKEAYQDALSEYHPHFWASKLHFFIDDVPFYNFPYTFGYLFSLSVYAEYLKQKDGFEEKYVALLRDTAVMTTEELVRKHLGADITQEAFWLAGIAIAESDVRNFLELTEAYL